jgi:hypothetical protein
MPPLRKRPDSGTIPRMQLPQISASAFQDGLTGALDELVEAFRLSNRQGVTDDAEPPLLAAAFEQLFDAMQRSEASRARENSHPAVSAQDITELGEYALGLLEQAERWANLLGLRGVFALLRGYTIAAACWVARHGGQLPDLEPVVDALAGQANETRDTSELLALFGAMGEVLEAAAPVFRQDLEKTNPGRPWRVLHLNRAIVATRTHRPELMEEAFDSLVEHLPEDAAGFFSQGMEQMDLLNYPAHVRTVMDRYYNRWSLNRSLH